MMPGDIHEDLVWVSIERRHGTHEAGLMQGQVLHDVWFLSKVKGHGQILVWAGRQRAEFQLPGRSDGTCGLGGGLG